MTHRIMPPPVGAPFNPITLGGIVYQCAQGATLDVPDHIADLLAANGWTKCADTGANSSARRPANPKKNQTFLDTTLGLVIKWNGNNWINPVNGSNA